MNSDPKEDDWTHSPSGLPSFEDQAIEWVAKLTSGKASAEDRAAFERWRAQSPEHESAAQAARQLWVGMGQALTDSRGSVVPLQARRSWVRRARPFALAASVLLGVFLAFQAVHNWRHDFVAATGQQHQVSLPDGTSVKLNSGTALDVQYTSRARRVVLARGEAFFDVTHNQNLPFIVQAGSAEVQVLGTAFSVRRDGDDVLVTVERGRVQVSAGGRLRVLRMDQSVRFQGDALGDVQAANPYTQLAWRRGRVIIEDQPLAQVIQELNRYYPGLIVVTNETAGARHLNAVIDLKHIDEWLAALGESQPVRINHLGPLIVVR